MTANGNRPARGGSGSVVVTLLDAASVDQWQAAAGSIGGDWANPAHWLGGQVPGSADAVAIGPSLDAIADFIVAATNESAGSLIMTTPQTPGGIGAGTLAVTGTLAIEGELALDHAELLVDGATVDSGEATLDGPGSSFDPGLGGALLEDGGTWRVASVQLGEIGSAAIDLQAGTAGTGGTLDVAGAISIGLDVDSLTTGIFAEGELSVAGASTVEAASLNLLGLADVSLDGTGAVVLGTAVVTAGAVAIGSDATLTVITGNIWGNLVDNGLVSITPMDSGDNFGTLTVHGTLSGVGGATVAGWLEVADAAAFTGTISLAPQGRFVVDDSRFGDMQLSMDEGTVALGSVPYVAGLAATYDAVAGAVSLAGVTLNVGTGLNAGDFTVQADPYGNGTDIVQAMLDIWQANFAGPGGDWLDPTHWSDGPPTLATDTVLIGPGLSATAPFGITADGNFATNLQLSAAQATLTAIGGLLCGPMLTLKAGTLVSAAHAQVVATTIDEVGGTLIADAGILDSTDATIENAVKMLDGASWATGVLAIDANVLLSSGPGGFITGQTLISTGDVSLSNGTSGQGGGLVVSGVLSLGSYDAGLIDAGLTSFSNFAGQLSVTGNSTVSAGSVSMSAGSTIALDSTAEMSVGTTPGPAGVVWIASTLTVGDLFGGVGPNSIVANVEDDGVLNFIGGGLAISGTLTGTGSLSVAGAMSVGALALSAATVTLGAGSKLTVAAGGAIALYGGALVADGGTISGGTGALLTASTFAPPTGSVGGIVTLQDGGTWMTPSLTVEGVSFTMIALRNGPSGDSGGTLDVSGSLEIGIAVPDASEPGTLTVDGASTVAAGAVALGATSFSPFISATGVLTVSDGADVAAGSLSLAGGSLLDMQDKTGTVRIGDATGVGGAVAIGAGATLTAGNGEIAGDVVDAGLLQVGGTVDADESLSLVGSLTGGGLVTVTDGTLNVADASQFAGTIAVGDNSLLAFDSGNLADAVLQLGTSAMLGLDGVAYSPDLVPSYDATTGQLTVGGVVVAVGTGYSVWQFGLSPGASGGTDVLFVTQDVWGATGAGTGGDWSDATHWSSGTVPGANDTVVIGLDVASASPWTVTVDTASTAGIVVLNAAAATLDIASTLNVVRGLTVDQGVLLDTGLLGAATVQVDRGTLLLDGGTLSSDATTIADAATLTDGALWFGFSLTMEPGGVLAVQGSTLTVAGPPAALTTLDVSDGGGVTIAALGTFGTMAVDSTSRIAIGTTWSPPGAVTIGNEATLTAGIGSVVDGDLEDDGTIVAGIVSETVEGTLLLPGAMTITGSLTGTGDVRIAGFAPGSLAATHLSLVNMQDFDGTVSLASGLLSLLTGDPRDASLTLGASGLLDLDAQDPSGAVAYDSTTGALTIGGSTLNVGPGLSLDDFDVRADGAGGTFVSEQIPCFVAGTSIAAERGEVPVEVLAPGDLVRTHSGALRPVRWVGRRRVDCRRHPRPEQVRPVRIEAGAFAKGQPGRGLLLSPDHAVFCDGVLIPVRYLVNGTTIAPVEAARVEYVHIELDSHDVLLAEGLPAESFLDTGNRSAFTGGGTTDLHPDFARRVWRTAGCAELVLTGPKLAKIRRRLLARAVALGHGITRGPGIVVTADGRRLAASVEGARWHVRVPAGATTVALHSRTWTPAHTDPGSDDPRNLGVAISRLLLDGREVALESPALAAGWHTPEPGWRWTDGAASLPAARLRSLTFEVAMTGRYWCDGLTARRARRLDSRQPARPEVRQW